MKSRLKLKDARLREEGKGGREGRGGKGVHDEKFAGLIIGLKTAGLINWDH